MSSANMFEIQRLSTRVTELERRQDAWEAPLEDLMSPGAVNIGMGNWPPPWLLMALQEMGQLEIDGPESNPRIDEYWAAVASASGDETDDIAWCSAFICWLMLQAGVAHTATAAARSWDNQLEEIATPRLGCLAVFWRGSVDGWRGHVGLWLQQSSTSVWVLGGNQNNSVCIKEYPRSQLLSYRWPAGEEVQSE